VEDFRKKCFAHGSPSALGFFSFLSYFGENNMDFILLHVEDAREQDLLMLSAPGNKNRSYGQEAPALSNKFFITLDRICLPQQRLLLDQHALVMQRYVSTYPRTSPPAAPRPHEDARALQRSFAFVFWQPFGTTAARRICREGSRVPTSRQAQLPRGKARIVL
jgi:hypothetical protein